MHNAYVDRGIMKWAPFDALSGHSAMIASIKRKRDLLEKPILSDDQYYEMNTKLNDAVQFNLDIQITYYSKGSILDTSGKIKKLNFIDGIIILESKESIIVNDILDLQVF